MAWHGTSDAQAKEASSSLLHAVKVVEELRQSLEAAALGQGAVVAGGGLLDVNANVVSPDGMLIGVHGCSHVG